MSVQIIQDAFMTDFAAMTLTGITKVYPNLPFTGVKPYASLQFVHVDPQAVGMASDAGLIYEGLMLVTVVTELGKGLEVAANAASLIAARYSYARTIAATGGRIEIPSPTHVMEGFRQDMDWRTPIRVPYRGHF